MSTPRASRPQISSQAASQEGGGIGTLRIVLHETDGPNERSVPLGDSPAVCEFIECRSRRPGMRKRQRKPRDGEDGPAPEPPLPLRWVALDPDLQWLADFRLEGIGTLDDTLRCLDEQLHHSRLAAAQWRAAETLVALAREEPCPRTRAAVLQSLSRAAASPDLFYRVRLCALRRLPEAEALARASGHEGRALTDVLDLLHRACPGGALRKVFADFSEYFVLKAAPGALACFRDGRGESPDEAIEAVLHILAEGDAVGVPHDASRLRAAFVEALGLARPVGPMLGRVVRELHRQIQVDWVMPSPEHALTQAREGRGSHLLCVGGIGSDADGTIHTLTLGALCLVAWSYDWFPMLDRALLTATSLTCAHPHPTHAGGPACADLAGPVAAIAARGPRRRGEAPATIPGRCLGRGRAAGGGRVSGGPRGGTGRRG